jgi:hypothetical protein
VPAQPVGLCTGSAPVLLLLLTVYVSVTLMACVWPMWEWANPSPCCVVASFRQSLLFSARTYGRQDTECATCWLRGGGGHQPTASALQLTLSCSPSHTAGPTGMGVCLFMTSSGIVTDSRTTPRQHDDSPAAGKHHQAGGLWTYHSGHGLNLGTQAFPGQ